MIRAKLVKFLIPVLTVTLTAACERRKEGPEGTTGRSVATEAYVRNFGPAPAVAEGECFAVAGFLPRQGNPGQVTPVPLFLFTPDGQEEKVVRHLIALDPKILPEELANPFPPGTSLDGFARQGSTAQIALAFPAGVPADPKTVQGIASALGHTLAQFPGIERVRITAGGNPLPNLASEGFVPDPADALEPEAPRLLGVAGTWEEGAQDPEEILALFDRPVKVMDIRFAAEGGAPLQGEKYQSMFDMAVILHPANPAEITAGMPVRVAWKITDRKGRTGQGEGVFPLQRQDR